MKREQASSIVSPGVAPEKRAFANELRRRMTRAEKRLWAVLRGNGVDGFHVRRQQLLEGYIVDFYCHATRLVVEVDGAIHARQREEDAARDGALSNVGMCTLRFSNDDVERSLSNVLAEIRRMCHIRAAELVDVRVLEASESPDVRPQSGSALGEATHSRSYVTGT